MGLLHRYDNSNSQLLAAIYPQYHWLPWKFAKCPRSYWDNVNNHIKFMEWAKNELKIKDLEDWYKISLNVLL